ncbi:MAG: sensor histidine kinase [Candidatus Methylomirabilales bacterium]
MLERTAILLGLTLASTRVQAALVERVKELTCLHGVTRALAHPGADLAAVLTEVAALLPPAWQYPEAARARILLDGTAYATPGFDPVRPRQSVEIVVRGAVRGAVEVAYVDDRPAADEGPFLREERALLTSVAHELTALLERRAAEAERARLEEQLRHAERLATIGQLSAGVAHELNEPLVSILGFAQLCGKHEALAPGVRRDLDRIVAAALHARETVKKLMLFARARPPARQRVAVDRILEEALGFVESRARQAGVHIRRRTAPDLPAVLADPNQLYQVVVNLVVNALQAMPRGGPLAVEATAEGGWVVLSVEDAGVGMTPEVRQRLFEPFFTTKGPGEGTGLGLSVVHGIVTSHGGHIAVQSQPGRGSRFEVRLPAAPAGHGGDPESA